MFKWIKILNVRNIKTTKKNIEIFLELERKLYGWQFKRNQKVRD